MFARPDPEATQAPPERPSTPPEIDIENEHKKLSAKDFCEHVNSALRKVLPSGHKPYRAVEVLFVTWYDNDVADTVEEYDHYLAPIFSNRGYQLDHFVIPTINGEAMLHRRLTWWIVQSTAKDTLKIFFYSGHGVMGGLDPKNKELYLW